MQVVVYYRSRAAEPDASKDALKAQHAAVEPWLVDHDAVAVAEFTEIERDTEARPQLGRALAACRKHDAALLVAMTDPIGSGKTFGPFSSGRESPFGPFYGSVSGVRCFDITHASLPSRSPEPRPKPEEVLNPPPTIPLPDEGPDRPFLHFEETRSTILLVYLCNPGPGAMMDVTLQSFGITSQWTERVTGGEGDDARTMEAPLETSVLERVVGAIPSGTCAWVDRYDLMLDSDLITFYGVSYTDDSDCQHRIIASVGRGGPDKSWKNMYMSLKMEEQK